MTDARLRDLARRFQETGSVEDHVPLLIERVRSGDLPQERLDLAAHCGHRAAALATGSVGKQSLKEFASGLAPFGQLVVVQAAALVMEAAAMGWPAWELMGRIAREWLACPCEEHVELARAARLEPSSDLLVGFPDYVRRAITGEVPPSHLARVVSVVPTEMSVAEALRVRGVPETLAEWALSSRL